MNWGQSVERIKSWIEKKRLDKDLEKRMGEILSENDKLF